MNEWKLYNLITIVGFNGCEGTVRASYNQLVSLFGGPPNKDDDPDKTSGKSFVVTDGHNICMVWIWHPAFNPASAPEKELNWSISKSLGSMPFCVGQLIDYVASNKQSAVLPISQIAQLVRVKKAIENALMTAIQMDVECQPLKDYYDFLEMRIEAAKQEVARLDKKEVNQWP